MCPQPLSRIRPEVFNYSFGTHPLSVRPDLMNLVLLTIAGWAVTEAQLGHVFATLLGAKKPVTMKMYAALEGFALRKLMLRTAAEEMLPKRYSAIFNMALTMLDRQADVRHKFAHRVWGTSQDAHMQDALLLVDPRQSWNLRLARIRHWKRYERIPNKLTAFMRNPEMNKAEVFVYRKAELEKILQGMERAFRMAQSLVELVGSTGERRKEIYRWLSREPGVAELLAKERQHQKGRRVGVPERTHKSRPKAKRLVRKKSK